MDRHLRIDLRRISTEARHGIPHRREIDDRRHSGEILHQHPGGAVLDLVGRALLLLPVDQRLDIGAGDGLAVLEAEEILEQHLHREGQARDVAEGGRGLFEGIISVGLAGGGEGGAGVEGVVADGGHGRPFGFGELSLERKHIRMRFAAALATGGASVKGHALRSAGLDPASGGGGEASGDQGWDSAVTARNCCASASPFVGGFAGQRLFGASSASTACSTMRVSPAISSVIVAAIV